MALPTGVLCEGGGVGQGGGAPRRVCVQGCVVCVNGKAINRPGNTPAETLFVLTPNVHRCGGNNRR